MNDGQYMKVRGGVLLKSTAINDSNNSYYQAFIKVK